MDVHGGAYQYQSRPFQCTHEKSPELLWPLLCTRQNRFCEQARAEQDQDADRYHDHSQYHQAYNSQTHEHCLFCVPLNIREMARLWISRLWFLIGFEFLILLEDVTSGSLLYTAVIDDNACCSCCTVHSSVTYINSYQRSKVPFAKPFLSQYAVRST